ncbi:MAG TPA: Fur family transcriptional regulator [Longimicrobium sp.]|nr:Fur family transcriptional regulator [Longimicrobium sp.]
MPPNVANVLATLAERSQRLTRARRAVVEALFAAGAPVTVRELHATLTAVDLVTVYRTLAWLVELGVAREVTAVRGAERFEPVEGNEHAHHLHCDRCGRVTTAPVCGVDGAVHARILRDYGFAVADHTLTFHGRCAECRGAAH